MRECSVAGCLFVGWSVAGWSVAGWSVAGWSVAVLYLRYPFYPLIAGKNRLFRSRYA